MKQFKDDTYSKPSGREEMASLLIINSKILRKLNVVL